VGKSGAGSGLQQTPPRCSSRSESCVPGSGRFDQRKGAATRRAAVPGNPALSKPLASHSMLRSGRKRTYFPFPAVFIVLLLVVFPTLRKTLQEFPGRPSLSRAQGQTPGRASKQRRYRKSSGKSELEHRPLKVKKMREVRQAQQQQKNIREH